MYYYVYNLQGDVTHILDASKNIVGTYQYDAWGKILNLASLTSIAKVNPFRYRGYYYDTESGFYYLNSRYYSAEWRRFINADSGIYTVSGSVNGYNLFAYCNNNPIIYADKTGNFPWLAVIVIGVTSIIGGILGATSNQSLINNVNTAKQNNNQNMYNPLINEKKSSESIVYVENNFFKKNNSSSYNISENNAIPPTSSVAELTTSDRIKNTIIGATLGAATGGIIVALVGAGLHFSFGSSAVIGGATGAQTFAIGALAFDGFSMIVAPFFGLMLESIEWE